MLLKIQTQVGNATQSKVSQLPFPMHLVAEMPQLNQAYMLAEHAEECSKTASAAAAMFRTSEGAPQAQLDALLDTANGASERVSWAVGWIDAYCPAQVEGDQSDVGQWLSCIRHIV